MFSRVSGLPSLRLHALYQVLHVFRVQTRQRVTVPSLDTDVPSSLSVKIEESCFLVSHPVNSPDKRSVMFIVRCNDAELLTYRLPFTEMRSSLDMTLHASTPTMLLANYTAAGGNFDSVPAIKVDCEIKDGKWLIVKHGDPWGLMLASSSQKTAWKALLQSLGGKYAAMAVQDKTRVPMQRHPLQDLL